MINTCNFPQSKRESTHPRKKKKGLKSPALHKLGNLESMRGPLARDPKVGKRPSPNKAASLLQSAKQRNLGQLTAKNKRNSWGLSVSQLVSPISLSS